MHYWNGHLPGKTQVAVANTNNLGWARAQHAGQRAIAALNTPHKYKIMHDETMIG